jgi:hypothetical protein
MQTLWFAIFRRNLLLPIYQKAIINNLTISLQWYYLKRDLLRPELIQVNSLWNELSQKRSKIRLGLGFHSYQHTVYIHIISIDPYPLSCLYFWKAKEMSTSDMIIIIISNSNFRASSRCFARSAVVQPEVEVLLIMPLKLVFCWIYQKGKAELLLRILIPNTTDFGRLLTSKTKIKSSQMAYNILTGEFLRGEGKHLCCSCCDQLFGANSEGNLV